MSRKGSNSFKKGRHYKSLLIAFLLLITLIPQIPSQIPTAEAYGESWLEGWTYRRYHNVTGTTDSYGADFCTGGSASASSEYPPSGYEAAKAFDNNDATYRWSSDNVAFPHWLRYDLGSGIYKRAQKLRFKPFSTPPAQVKDFILQGSNDTVSWTDILSAQCADSGTWQEWTFENDVSYRYYQIRISSSYYTGGNQVSIWEVEILGEELQTDYQVPLAVYYGNFWDLNYTAPIHGYGSAALTNGSIIVSYSTTIQRTDDGGETFVNVTTTAPFSDARMAASNNDTLFAWFWMDKLYRSIDYGKTWSVVHQRPNADESYWNICFDPSNNDIIWASGYGGGLTSGHAQLYKSTNHGASFSLIYDFGTDYRHIHEVGYNPVNGWLYCLLGDAGVVTGDSAGIFRSKNGGTSFVRIFGGTTVIPYSRTSVVFNQTWVYVGSDESGAGGNMDIYYANDTGADSITFTELWDRGAKGDIYWMRVTPDGYLVMESYEGVSAGVTCPLYASNTNTSWASFREIESVLKSSTITGYAWATDKFGGPDGNIIFVSKFDDSAIDHPANCNMPVVGQVLALGNRVALCGKCQLDFDDVRFTEDDGVTLLSYWIETKTDSISADFWVMLNSIPASPIDAMIYIYYGNDEVSTTSDGETTFPIFFDDFENDVIGQTPAGWIKNSGSAGDIIQTDNSVVYQGSKSAKIVEDGVSPDGRFSINLNETCEDVLFHGWFRFTTAAKRAYPPSIWGINFLVRDDSSDWRCVSNAVWVTIPNWGNPSPNTWYRTELHYDESADKVLYLQNRAASSGWLTGPGAWGEDGITNIGTGGTYSLATTSYVDVMYVRMYANPEPQHAEWGPEETEGGSGSGTSSATNTFLEIVNAQTGTYLLPKYDWYRFRAIAQYPEPAPPPVGDQYYWYTNTGPFWSPADAYILGTTYDDDDAIMTLIDTTHNVKLGVIFQDVLIPQGAEIVEAYIRMSTAKNTLTSGSGLATRIRAVDSDNVDSRWYEGTLRDSTLTSAYVDWDITGFYPQPSYWVSNYNTTDIKSVVQEVVNRAGWGSGQKMGFVFTASVGSGRREMRALDDGEFGLYDPYRTKLFVKYKVESGGGSGSPTPAYENIDKISIAFSDGTTWINATATRSTGATVLDSGSAKASVLTPTTFYCAGGTVVADIEIMLDWDIQEVADAELYMKTYDTTPDDTGWEEMQSDYINIEPDIDVTAFASAHPTRVIDVPESVSGYPCYEGFPTCNVPPDELTTVNLRRADGTIADACDILADSMFYAFFAESTTGGRTYHPEILGSGDFPDANMTDTVSINWYSESPSGPGGPPIEPEPEPTPSPPSEQDTDGDGIPDSLDPDDDNDGISDVIDTDDNNDGIPDVIDTDNDLDNDGIPNDIDPDIDNDGIPNEKDTDNDNDGIPDSIDLDDNNNGIPDVDEIVDTDDDGIPDWQDPDDDNDGIVDDLDPDDDNDNIPDTMEDITVSIDEMITQWIPPWMEERLAPFAPKNLPTLIIPLPTPVAITITSLIGLILLLIVVISIIIAVARKDKRPTKQLTYSQLWQGGEGKRR